MRILDRMVAVSFLKLFTAFVIGAPVLFVLGDLTENQDTFLDERGLGWGEVLLSYLYMLPNYILWSFPIAALIAAVFTVNTMTANHEVVAAKAGGISFPRLIAPILLCGAVLTGVALALTVVVPGLNRKAGEIRRVDDRPQGWRSNFVYLGEDGRTISIRRLTLSERRLEDLVMETGPDDDGRVLHTVARRADWDPDRGWILRDGEVRQLMPGGAEAAFRFTEMLSTGFTERPEDLLETPPEEDEMGYREMGRLADVIRRSGGTPYRLLTKKEQRLAIPAATLIIILFGAPLATSSKRGGAAFGVGVSLASTILYLVLFKVIGSGFGYTGILPALWAAWLPNIVFLLAGLVLLQRVRT